MITDILEALTIFCFGLSWPISIRKSIISRTAKGKSLFFEVFLLVGYACGIARKIIQVSCRQLRLHLLPELLLLRAQLRGNQHRRGRCTSAIRSWTNWPTASQA